ncbi:MAG: hypothetical protein SF002_16520 [Alphaproteobacteria bacterium]|nr:hypothetical protein [Alphaproteobacteria bacterium]
MTAVAFWSEPYEPTIEGDPEILGMLDWYRGLARADGALPRAAIDPLALRRHIGRLCLYQMTAEGRLRVRLRGEQIGERSHEDAAYLDENRPPAYRDSQLVDFHAALRAPHPCVHRVFVRAGEEQVFYRRLLVPVASTAQRADMLLLFNPDAQPGGRPSFMRVFERARWLSIGLNPPEDEGAD